ncbi:hypothetical protein CLV86_0466 [Lacinutrix venerupis]|uniref:hypothetical protein n=1 Tax=Lacinutrix venerupis TaxID=1486034 RepID=UPI000EB14631|nr:hypothetical protein [Lacinutrix venerupis]RLJ69073.1 hypothetical protein CLV86_0466 [Lacinutrix venerupis]
MKDDKIHQLFEKFQHDFDVETPNHGHKNRFLEKLNAQNNTQNIVAEKANKNLWKPFLGVAATIVLLITLAFSFNTEPKIQDLASVSPEMANTQNFFTSVIAEELEKINSERTPETEALIKDAMSQMEILEIEYSQLKIDLTESGNDKRVIHAMIDNFWNRINILKSVLENIEGIKTFKLNTDETINTI